MQIERIKQKIEKLKSVDQIQKLFGSNNHKYKLNDTVGLNEVLSFEKNYNIILPKEYVEFITQIGNGGVGPFYGLEPFENCLFDDLDYKRKDSLLNPQQPFIHTQAWNLEFNPSKTFEENSLIYEEELLKFDEKYFDNNLMNGAIAICNFGCAVNLYLVVNGEEYGNIWTDDRSSDLGIHPSIELGNKERITFLNWYELWLDNSFTELEK